jgi:hypothetical protein
MLLLSRLLLLRVADRQFLGLLFQEPPRFNLPAPLPLFHKQQRILLQNMTAQAPGITMA